MKDTLNTKLTYKEIISLILENKPITETQLNEFITEYCKQMLDKELTLTEILGINQGIQMGIFDPRYAANIAGIKLGLNIVNVFGKQGQLLKTIVY